MSEKVSDGEIRSTLDRLATTGLPIYISELDINFSNDDAQLNRFKTLFPLLWHHPAVKGITFWGYKEHHIWRRQAYLLRGDGTERPALTWLRQYLHEHSAAEALPLASHSNLSLALWIVGGLTMVLIFGTSAWLYLSRAKAQK